VLSAEYRATGVTALTPRIAVGLHLPPKPPVVPLRAMVYAARLMRLESLTLWDHFQDFFPRALWEKEFSWLAGMSSTPHDFLEFQTTLGYLAAHAGGLRLGVAVTEPVRRHPVLIAQAMMTLAHFTKRAPILGIGSGERENTEPYGLSFETPVGRLEEALKIIRLCFDAEGDITFHGRHFQLDRAVMDLKAPATKRPRIWVASHGPRMLRLTGQYGDGWYPNIIASPEDYRAKLDAVRDAAMKAGRDPDRITPALQAYLVVAHSEAETRRLLESKAVRYIAVLAPAATWEQFGQRHPFGEDFKGFTDFLPEHHTRQELEDAIAAVPPDVLANAIFAGTPEQIVARLRDFGDAGLRYVMLDIASATVSAQAAAYGLWAARKIRVALARG
jgi:phthiodiolone/phenolphthiodiolone dimycocerosates ketoreductase